MCTNLRVIAKDGSVVIGRTMDLGINLQSKLCVFPRNYKITSSAPNNQSGKSWQTKFGYVGMNSLDQPQLSDGINESGLYCGALYLPGFTEYQRVSEGNSANAVAQIDVMNYILSLAANVEEAKSLLQNVTVWSMSPAAANFPLDLHYIVHDKSGACAVFEYVDGQLKTYDNKLGALTNAPTFDWHLINLRNFVNLSPQNSNGLDLSGVGIKALGEGSGMLGLPGDFTPPSRFIRAVALTQSAFQPENAEQAVITTQHIINNFDVVQGVARPISQQENHCDYTQWSTLADLSNGNYYIRMHDKPGYSRLTLSSFDLNSSEVKTLDPTNMNWYNQVAA